MTAHTPEPPFPCPFCESTHVVLVGSGLVFLHYKCGACAEVWTAMAAARPALLRPAYAQPEQPEEAVSPAWPAHTPPSKFWRH